MLDKKLFFFAQLYRFSLRYRVSKLIKWTPSVDLKPGGTIVIGMCSKLHDILYVNLACLDKNKWAKLEEIIIVVDTKQGVLPNNFEQDIVAKFPNLALTFLYYNHQQARFTEKLKHPLVYAWLSWCIGLNHVKTETALIQDYDALILDNKVLEKRYQVFLESKSVIQGIAWYKVNGFKSTDKLCSTFEALVDINWVKSFPPVRLFSKVGVFDKRQVDYDILLDIQANHTPETQRTIFPMSTQELVHPSQVIHQYTMFRKFPRKKLPCSSIIIIPFFHLLSGKKEALSQAIQAIQQGDLNKVDLLGDNTQINLSLLETSSVNFILKLMLRLIFSLEITPFKGFIDYGSALYTVSQTPPELFWVGDFTEEQKQWIKRAENTPNHQPQIMTY